MVILQNRQLLVSFSDTIFAAKEKPCLTRALGADGCERRTVQACRSR
jgi:hypothetical protein